VKKHEDPAIVTWEDSDPDHKFTEAIANHRVWELEAERNA
jgi:catalase